MPAVQEVVRQLIWAFCLKNIPYDKRIYSIEDSRELDLIAKDDNGKVLNRVIHTVTRPHEDPKSNVDAELLFKGSIKTTPGHYRSGGNAWK